VVRYRVRAHFFYFFSLSVLSAAYVVVSTVIFSHGAIPE